MNTPFTTDDRTMVSVLDLPTGIGAYVIVEVNRFSHADWNAPTTRDTGFRRKRCRRENVAKVVAALAAELAAADP